MTLRHHDSTLEAINPPARHRSGLWLLDHRPLPTEHARWEDDGGATWPTPGVSLSSLKPRPMPPEDVDPGVVPLRLNVAS